jgi:hypothetical protein
MFRRIFVILVRDSSILNGMTYSSSGDVAVRAAVDQIHLLSTATEPEETDEDESKQEDGTNEKEEERAPPTNGLAIADTDSLVLYDWYLNALPEGILIEELPKPGILIAIVSSESEYDPEATESLKYQIRLLAEKADEKLGMRVRNYMVSPDAGFEPIPLKRYDVFLSHDTDDRADALVLRDALKGRGLSCFVASESLPVGSPWKDELLQGVRNARVGVVLLTERSIASKWVLCEVGGLWGAGVPIVPVLRGIQFAQVPEIISSFQWYTTTDWNNLDSFSESVYQLCRNPPKR